MRGEGDPHTDTEAAYHEQQLLEEGDDPVTGDQPALPPDSILDSSGDEESHPVSSGPQVPHMASSARRPPTDTAASPGAVNTTYSVPAGAATPTEEGHAVATVQLDANSMYRVPKEPSAPLSEPAPPANIVSAMEGVAPATYSGSPPTEYFAIKNKLRIKNSFSDLIDGEKEVLIKPGTCGSFFLPGDTREYLCDVKVDIQAGSVISTSFNSVNMSCSCCGQFMFKSGNTGSTSRAVLILSDQAFPAAAPAARGDGGCLKVFRSESASLLDIVGGFLAVAGGWRLRPGSLILLSSASHLAHCGLEAYVNDFVLAAKTLQLKTGAEIGPAPILLMGGTNDKLLIRSLVDLATWQKRFYSNDRSFVADSISATIVALAEMGLGGRQPAYDCRYGLPSSISNTATKRYWISSGLSALPERIGPLTEALERTIITKMINFLNESHAFNLDPAPILDKQVAAPGTKSTDSVFVCVGNSHAKRTKACRPSCERGALPCLAPQCGEHRDDVQRAGQGARQVACRGIYSGGATGDGLVPLPGQERGWLCLTSNKATGWQVSRAWGVHFGGKRATAPHFQAAGAAHHAGQEAYCGHSTASSEVPGQRLLQRASTCVQPAATRLQEQAGRPGLLLQKQPEGFLLH